MKKIIIELAARICGKAEVEAKVEELATKVANSTQRAAALRENLANSEAAVATLERERKALIGDKAKLADQVRLDEYALATAHTEIAGLKAKVKELEAEGRRELTVEEAVAFLGRVLDSVEDDYGIKEAINRLPDAGKEYGKSTKADYLRGDLHKAVTDAKSALRGLIEWRGLLSWAMRYETIRYGRVVKAPATGLRVAAVKSPLMRFLSRVYLPQVKDPSAVEALGEEDAAVWNSMTRVEKARINKWVAKALQYK